MGAETTKEWKGMQPRQKARVFDTLQNGRIIDGEIIAPDGVNVSHRLKVEPRKTISQQRFVKNRSKMALFSDENGGHVLALYESCEALSDRFPSLTQADIARLMFVGTYTGYDGRLRYDNGTTITRAKLEKMIGISREQFSKFYNRLISENALHEEGGQISVNSSVFQRGEVSGDIGDLQYIRVYRDTVRNLYDEYGKGRDARQLAIVFLIIPFLHYNANIVCYNPQEYYFDQIRPMTVDKLAALLGYKKTRSLKTAMNKVMINGQPVFAFVEDVHDRRKRRIIVNPRVIFAGNDEGLERVQALAAIFN